MRTSDLIKRSVKYYWRTNLPVVFGVATAVAVLAGALLVGDSVRASLRDLFLQRLGHTDHVIAAPGFFREQLAEDIRPKLAAHGFSNSCPLIELEGSASSDNGARAGGVRVYGVDARFWQFHGRDQRRPENREALISDSLSRELNIRPGDSLLIRIQKPSDVPLESLFGRKDEAGVTLRLTIREALSPAQLGEFSTRPQQGGVRAVFVPLQLLQKELGQPGRANTILVSSSNMAGQSETEKTKALANLLKDTAHLDDYNIKLRVLDPQNLSVENRAGVISENLAKQVDEAMRETGNGETLPLMSYLVNNMQLENGRTIPYSIVTGVKSDFLELIQRQHPGCDNKITDATPLVLNEWAANDLGAKLKDRITLDYYVWLDQGQLATRSTEFRVACIIPMEGLAADRNLVPDYPGITESENVSDWDPPFPMDLDRIRPQDEDYWKKYRTTPKAFVRLEDAQKLWQSRFGKLTSLRINLGPGRSNAQIVEQSLRNKLEPAEMGLAILPVRAEGLAASRGATDFGEYFLYFSFFLVVSALLLASLFFKFGIEQRVREIGTLQAIGFPRSKIRNLFLAEGLVLSLVGSLLGLLGAVAYGYVILLGLRTWWVDAVGTTQLRLHVSAVSLLLGGIGGVLAAVICVAWTLRRLGKASSRSLFSGVVSASPRLRLSPSASWRLWISIALTALALLALLAATFQIISQTAGFFGSGTLLLVALLYFVSAWLRRPRRKAIRGRGWPAVWRLGFRNAVHQPSRSVMCIALIAMSAFIVVTVEAF
ncbi:MAG: FtsX-like permease family protein, partial [Limisphaerales bacterium]